MNETDDDASEVGIMDVPGEILEYILSLVSPYNDFQSARLVCRLWYKIMQGVVQQKHDLFMTSCRDGVVTWDGLDPEFGTMIKERYSHSACYHNKAIYVFGGCTATATTFNDLWRFDLSTRQWVRPLAIGTYPSPKACASLVSYKDSLILFGGWSHPTPLPLHQPNNFFNQLHIYSPKTNNWSLVSERVSRTGVPQGPPPGRAGHASSIIGDTMVVFGGSRAHSTRCHDVWVLDLDTMEWTLMAVQGTKPRPRFGHSQIVLDRHHILIIGGCAGPNMQFSDVWLLKMGQGDWCWHEVAVSGQEHSPPKIWCHPACKVGDHVIILSQLSSRSPRLAALEAAESSKLASTAASIRTLHVDMVGRKSLPKRPAPETSESSSQESSSDSEDRVMNARKYLSSSYNASRMTAQLSTALTVNKPDGCDGDDYGVAHGAAQAGPSGQQAGASWLAAPIARPSHFEPNEAHLGSHTIPVREGKPSIRPNAMKNRQKQLEALRRHELRIHSKLNHPPPPNPQNPPPPKRAQEEPRVSVQKTMFIHALDISRAIVAEEVRWLEVGVDYEGLPAEEKMFYSLIHARGELVMFGGIKSEVQTMQQVHSVQIASNTTHFITAKPKLR